MKTLLFLIFIGVAAGLTVGGVNVSFDYVNEAFQVVNGGLR